MVNVNILMGVALIVVGIFIDNLGITFMKISHNMDANQRVDEKEILDDDSSSVHTNKSIQELEHHHGPYFLQRKWMFGLRFLFLFYFFFFRVSVFHQKKNVKNEHPRSNNNNTPTPKKKKVCSSSFVVIVSTPSDWRTLHNHYLLL